VRIVIFAFFAVLAVPHSVAGESRSSTAAPSVDDICRALHDAAQSNGVPVQFLTRLIWQESRFKSSAVSPKGAQGIAQFMPSTARLRGLPDPFEPIDSLAKSAAYLRELFDRFGNLGLAAAAYNAGERRLADWLSGRGQLPAETRNYVRIITGHPAEAWKSDEPPEKSAAAMPPGIPCEEIAGQFVAARTGQKPSRSLAQANWSPWGVQVTAHWSSEKALSLYSSLQRRFPRLLEDRPPMLVNTGGGRAAQRTAVRVPMHTRGDADRFCGDLRTAGGSCMVLKSPGSSAGS
jgi:hypothetical protein